MKRTDSLETCYQPAQIAMNLHHLLVFHSIAKTGSITSSSRQLRISQPALSRELRELEKRFGVTLFDRVPRGMRLTHAGKILNEYADRLFTVAHAAELAMKDISSARTGHLSLAASNMIGIYVLPRMLSEFRNNYPGIKVSLFVGNTAQVSQGIADQRFSLGFIEGPLRVRGVTATRFRDDELLPVVAAGHRLAHVPDIEPSDLDGEPLLMREAGSGTRDLIVNVLRELQIAWGQVMEFGSNEAIKQTAIHGGGIAWLPTLSIGAELKTGMLVPLASDQLRIRRSLSVIRRTSATGSPADEAFMRLLTQQKERIQVDALL